MRVHQYSDYVLFGRDGKPVAVVEAKKTSKDAEVGREQAKQYCYNIQKQYNGELPFCFYTNGLELYFWDLESYPPRKVFGYPTPDDFERFQYIRKNRKKLGPAQFDFNDLLKNKEMVEFGPEHSAVSVSQYREMVEKLIMELTETNPILQKIKEGKKVSEDEADELANLLHDEHPHITEDLLKNVYKNRKAKFIQFIRHILGLEVLESYPETVTKAFDEFIHSHSNLSSRQLDFLHLLKDFILEKEAVKKRDLIEPPFTIIHPRGIRGIFSPLEINEILNMTDRLAV